MGFGISHEKKIGKWGHPGQVVHPSKIRLFVWELSEATPKIHLNPMSIQGFTMFTTSCCLWTWFFPKKTTSKPPGCVPSAAQRRQRLLVASRHLAGWSKVMPLAMGWWIYQLNQSINIYIYILVYIYIYMYDYICSVIVSIYKYYAQTLCLAVAWNS